MQQRYHHHAGTPTSPHVEASGPDQAEPDQIRNPETPWRKRKLTASRRPPTGVRTTWEQKGGRHPSLPPHQGEEAKAPPRVAHAAGTGGIGNHHKRRRSPDRQSNAAPAVGRRGRESSTSWGHQDRSREEPHHHRPLRELSPTESFGCGEGGAGWDRDDTVVNLYFCGNSQPHF